MWFKSKLENPDPEIRRQHVELLDPEDDLLNDVAKTDPHPDVRSAALTRILDLKLLDDLSRGDADQRVRSLATARLQTLLCGFDEPGPPLDQRLAFFSASADQRIARVLARSAAEPELRKLAVTRLLDNQSEPDVQDLLCDIAAEDSVQEIRETAAQPIHDVQRLQNLLEKARGKDKSIHRLARERLDSIQTQSDAREALEKCCLEAEELAAQQFSTDGKIEEVRLQRISDEWDKALAISSKLDESVKKRYQTARDAIAKRLTAIAEQRRSRGEILDALQLHLSDSATESVAVLIRKWHELDEPSTQQARDFTKLVAEVTAHDSQRDRDDHRVVAKQALLQRMEEATTAETLQASVLQRLEKRWEASPDPEDESRVQELNELYLPLREKLRARIEKQAKDLEERLAKVAALLDDYEAAAKDGKLKVASSAHDKIVSVLAQLDAPPERKHALSKRLRACEPQMAELRRWRHWGTLKKREELCEQIESLTTTDMKISVIAKTVRDSREAWKALDKSDGAANKKLWTRFDAACEKAYEPCQAHFEQQKAQRKGNMAKRVQLCEELEALGSDTDWDAPPWRELSEALHEKQRLWRVAGAVDRREKNAIQKRFETAYTAIDERLTAKRLAEIERREALISRVEALATAENNADAVEVAKRAQRDWKPVVQGGRRKEQDLWKRFRAACDAVFENRKEQFAAADAERAQNLIEKQAVCDQFEEIVNTLNTQLESDSADAEKITESRKKANELNSSWQAIGPVPRNKQQSIDKRFDGICKQLDKLCSQLDDQLKEQANQAMRVAASTCDELELAIANGQPAASEKMEQVLEKLGTNRVDAGLSRRIKRLQAALADDAVAIKAIREALPSNLETRRKICLELEIAANIDSPGAYQEERMQYRVKALAESMSGTRQQMSPTELQQLWYETGPVSEADMVELDQRFNRAVEALGSD